MQFDPANNVFKLCADGMSLEGQGKKEEAYELFMRAWNESTNDYEKFTAAHYVARHQNKIADKLRWDQISLDLAMKCKDEDMRSYFSSLYLNIAKCYEDLKDYDNAKMNYQLALSFTIFLPEDGYGKMIKVGINDGIGRVKN